MRYIVKKARNGKKRRESKKMCMRYVAESKKLGIQRRSLQLNFGQHNRQLYRNAMKIQTMSKLEFLKGFGDKGVR